MIHSETCVQTGQAKQRLAGILAADAVGFSSSMAVDQQGTLSDLDAARAAFRQSIEAHHGRVVDMAGDSVLAVFETAAAALGAAVATQQAMARLFPVASGTRAMRFRIGIHIGDVAEKPDGTIYGDGVNIAARLQSVAEPGGISVSDSVLHAVRGQVAR